MKQKLTRNESEELIGQLRKRFEKNMNRHKDVDWGKLEEKLRKSPAKLRSLYAMEETGGEPDVVGYDKKNKVFLIFDCAKESPKGRRSICYDQDALESRKKHKPRDSAMNMADEMGIRMLSEEEYEFLQSLGEFDNTTSSWLVTPPDVRERGGAIFGDRRFGRVFIYHNGADSYYGARGFRGVLEV